MGDSSSNDPFTWGIDDVIGALCVDGKPWARNVAALTTQISEEEVDGQTLLTYEYIYSQRELMESLGIKPAGQRAALGMFVKALRARSSGFREWKRGQDELELLQETPKPEPLSGLRSPTVTSHREVSVKPTEDDTITPAEAAFDMPRKRQSPAPAALSSNPSDTEEQPDAPEPKRRRIAPENLTVESLNEPSAYFIPTDADNIVAGSLVPALNSNPFPWENSEPTAYLGDGILDRSTIRSITEPTSSFVVDVNDDDFYVASNCSIPAGRRLVVMRSMLKFMQRNSTKEAALARGDPADVLSETASDTELGLEDLADKFDEETWREIQEEREWRESRAAAADEGCLPTDEVENILHDAMHEMEHNWRSVKLPKHEHKAYALWTKAARQGFKNLLSTAQRQASHHDGRVQTLCDAIVKQKWKRASEVRLQARSFDAHLEDKLYNVWLVQLYSSRDPPARAPAPQKDPSRPRKPQVIYHEDEDYEEILSSDDEDFVVPDQPEEQSSHTEPGHGLYNPNNVDLDWTEPSVEIKPERNHEEHAVIDLTQADSSMDLMPRSEIATPSIPDKAEKEPSAPVTKKSARKTPKGGQILQLDPPKALESYSDVEEIGNKPWRYWAENSEDRWKLVICVLWKLGTHTRRQAVLSAFQDEDSDHVYAKTIAAQLSNPLGVDDVDKDLDRGVAYDVTRLFLSCLKCKAVRDSRIKSIIVRDKKLLRRKDSFGTFHHFLRSLTPYFPSDNQIFNRADIEDSGSDDDDAEVDFESSQPESSSKRRAVRGKEVIQNKAAVDLREREKRQAEEMEKRRQTLLATLSSYPQIPSDLTRLIINDTKTEAQGLIYVHDNIAKQIKDHQIEGVKFMWNQVLLHQGCLLAHTMGLGKTMQVITLLVAIANASKSTDRTILGQIPDTLRRTQTLVLCPPGLVENWQDEFLMWAPKDMLGRLFRVDAFMSVGERLGAVRTWSEEGGVLIIGYSMFKQLVDDVRVQDLLYTRPNIVVADEAHNLKNPTSKVSQACSGFHTRSRIALTGTPLANNVEEYYTMIDWVAPNFLGPLSEFREIYANPIQQGLYSDSNAWQRRTALKYLHTLIKTVQPKMNRATMNCMRNDLPPKHEFVIYVAPSEVQRQLYDTYIEGLASEGYTTKSEGMAQARMFTVVNHLGLICNHPLCFREKISRKVEDMSEDEGSGPFPPEVATKSLELTATANNPYMSGKIEYLELILEESRRAGEKVLVFSQQMITLDYLERLLLGQKRKVLRLDGKTKADKRQDDVKRFNLNNFEVYLISTKAGGVGLNIQSASRVVIFDAKWNPVDDQQAIGRAWRIGQQKPVYVYRLLVAGTYEEDLQMKSVFKLQLSSRVVDKKNPLSKAQRGNQLIHRLKDTEPKDLVSFKGKDHILRKLIDRKGVGSIREIITADTFEEEDEKADLTAEERKEAEELAVKHKLRLEDPAEYQRRYLNVAQGNSLLTSQAPVLSAPHLFIPHSANTVPAPISPHRPAQSFPNVPAQNVPTGPVRTLPNWSARYSPDGNLARAIAPAAPSSTQVPSPLVGVHQPPATREQPQTTQKQPETTQEQLQAQVPVSTGTLDGPPQATDNPISNREPFPGAIAWQPQPGQPSPPPSTPGPPNHTTPGPPNRTMDGAADSPIVVDSDSESSGRPKKGAGTTHLSTHHKGFSLFGPLDTQPTLSPLPITGANTFIGKQDGTYKHEPSPPFGHGLPFERAPSSGQTVSQNHIPASQQVPIEPTQKPPFSHLPHIPIREAFCRQLALRTNDIQFQGYPLTSGEVEMIARNVTQKINEMLGEEGNGTLPDSRQWQLLLDHLHETRFVAALVSGLWTTKFAALTKKKDLEDRINTANGFTEAQFRAQIKAKIRQDRDEKRGTMNTPTEESDVAETTPREASGDRTPISQEQARQGHQRVFRLPLWANMALSESSRGSTPQHNESPGS